MRKIIASLMALTITSTVAANVVSCGSQPPRQIPTKYGVNITYPEYTDSDMFNAYNGSGKTPYASILPLNSLLYRTLNLFSFSSSIVTNLDKLSPWRELFIGNDEKIEIARTAPAVDGIYFAGGKDHTNDVEHVSPQDFYNNYKTTHINSLAGLYQLYNFVKDGKVHLDDANSAVNDSYLVIKNALEGSTAQPTKDFLDSFLNLSNQSWDHSWIEQTISAEQQHAELDSQILSYNIETTGEGDEQTAKFQFSETDNPTMSGLGKTDSFVNINTKYKDDKDEGKIGDRSKSPFDLLMLPTAENVSGNQTSNPTVKFDTAWVYPLNDKGEPDKDKVDATKTWDTRKPSDSDWGDKGWSIKADPAFETKKDDKLVSTGFIKTNESIIIPIQPIKITYLYSTNAREANASRYEVSITLNNLQAVFRPLNLNSQFKNDDDKKTIGNQYVKWQFTHYQFNNQIDNGIWVNKDKTKQAQNGFYSDMFISNLSVIEANA